MNKFYLLFITLSYGVEDGITCGIMKRRGIIYKIYFFINELNL
jgi:hypothetical protein